jgi:hypothetical protein
MPKPPIRKAMPSNKSSAQSKPSEEYVDSYGITYLNGVARVKVQVDIKLSRNYQSAGVSGGMEFDTKPELVDESIHKAQKKVREALLDEVGEVSKILDTLG